LDKSGEINPNSQSPEFLGLDNNLFTGSIPSSLSRLKGLKTLSLADNKLTGHIPPQLHEMIGLQELYLSPNNLFGVIPAGPENVSSLIKLDVSYNHLEGQVPKLGAFANTMGGFQMAGNNALCGSATRLHLPPCPTLMTSNSTGV
jgi:hypothetical protein